MKIRKTLITVLTFAMIATSFAQRGQGGRGSSGQGGGQHGQRDGDLLTDEQKQELHDLISSMRENDASREDVKEAVDALFAEWGIERPERDGRGKGGNKGSRPDLTEEQKTELKDLTQTMKDEGATREEIHAAVAALFADWGIEMPNNPGSWGRKGGKGRGNFDPQLTDEQRETLRVKIVELKEADATREEIKAAVETLYDEWGLEMPERNGRWENLLTEEQQEQLKTVVQNLKDQDASRKEIKEAIDALFEEWGIDRPDFKKGFNGKNGKRKGRGWMDDLSEEQRTVIRQLIQTMKEDDATREEIHEAVKKQLEEWGVGGDEKEGEALLKKQGNIQAANSPNPFNPTTTISYSLKQPGHVSVKVYNTQGQLIRTLVNAYANEGSHAVVWNGLNEKGEQVSSGLYFYKVTSANETVTERMMMMK